ncbi:DUF7853 family protein [Haloarchaeobius iranensis]|uniref:Uncharacterized protein n=1 Tax=Haloarchaeobius iranensis TaxID=996166 RepID=A0A1G9WY06_9EURY|nr:hypothetical protein [Haloarchaeobius iranensis]SDM89337.1 hypothetical protein SAMN05192554_10942 [Haloarchaeobius iranensis]
MSSARKQPRTADLSLSRGELWLVHHVMVERLTGHDEDDPQPWWALNIARKLEAGDPTLTTFEAWRLWRDLREYAERDSTPASDVAQAQAIIDRLEASFGRVPLS